VKVSVANFYIFAQLNLDTITALQVALDTWSASTASLGLVVLAQEGINATLSGEREHLVEALATIEEIAKVRLEPKWSKASKQVFFRWKVDIRKEIVTLDFPCVGLKSPEDSFLSPKEWHERLSDQSKKAPVLLDFRNDYETKLGTFNASIDPDFTTFTDLAKYSEDHPELKEEELYIFCTGGIRCEKAAPYLAEKGFRNVKQLHGGILKYIEEFPNQHFKGECFVFDHRVAVDQDLNPSQRYWLCPLCGDPGDIEVKCLECGSPAKICACCVSKEVEPLSSFDKDALNSESFRPTKKLAVGGKFCSKNCRHHYQRKLAR